ncbi:hypothetical protein SAMN02745213_02347 [Succinivibrio dextrinosolvens DSM 3072]|uniref:Uncharacterized protein n=1 Tax=Succinivibrio dextrinosolvens DSM 3072 TaxID=1123324 RepID=A0A1T4W0K6_9GAMM|nr:hypothetical protein [Succinivibrio dextrinosolvens]SKA70615.1 hypothetical protein SAMN02745213_02347 [Succinivibrio dextrinosolvens DSM 3072]
MGLVYVRNKKTGVTYVYENQSYWDKELKQPRSIRKLIGKLDPDTGKFIETKKRKITADSDHSKVNYEHLYKKAQNEITKKNALITELRNKLNEANSELSSLNRRINRIREELCYYQK